jgi:hypothetical protein
MAKHATAIALWQVGRQVPPVESGSYDGSPVRPGGYFAMDIPHNTTWKIK